jgi:neutral ceramidase
VNLPPADASAVVFWPFERMTSNLLHWLMWPGTTEVSYLTLGPVKLALLPGELVSKLGLQWRPLLGGATIVSLMDDYVGYIETPDAIERKVGEAQRSYFGPSLAPVLLEGLEAARTAQQR